MQRCEERLPVPYERALRVRVVEELVLQLRGALGELGEGLPEGSLCAVCCAELSGERSAQSQYTVILSLSLTDALNLCLQLWKFNKGTSILSQYYRRLFHCIK